MKYNLRPTFRAIRYFEVLTNTPFTEIENNPANIVPLLYSCLLAHPENNFRMSYDTAVREFFPKIGTELGADFQVELEILAQFKNASIEEENNEDDKSIKPEDKSSPKENKNMFLSSVIPILVKDCGLDIHFVMDEMDYTDTELFIKSSIEHKRERMEEERFWTFFNILPHVNSKKLKEPKDLIEFEWEKGKRKRDAIDKMKTDRDKLIALGFIKEDDEENKGEDE